MSSILKVKEAFKIVERATITNRWPKHNSDPEINFLVDMMLDGWGTRYEEQQMYINEVTKIANRIRSGT